MANIEIDTGSTSGPSVSKLGGLGTGVAAALATNVGSAGAPVVNGGALGTPSSGTLTNATAATAAANTNTTQLATTAFVQGEGQGVKRYRATLTFAGNSIAVGTLLENTLGGTLVWSRTSAGVYVGTLAGAFPSGKCLVYFSVGDVVTPGSDGVIPIVGFSSANTVNIRSLSQAGAAADIATSVSFSSISITVFP